MQQSALRHFGSALLISTTLLLSSCCSCEYAEVTFNSVTAGPGQGDTSLAFMYKGEEGYFVPVIEEFEVTGMVAAPPGPYHHEVRIYGSPVDPIMCNNSLTMPAGKHLLKTLHPATQEALTHYKLENYPLPGAQVSAGVRYKLLIELFANMAPGTGPGGVTPERAANCKKAGGD